MKKYRSYGLPEGEGDFAAIFVGVSVVLFSVAAYARSEMPPIVDPFEEMIRVIAPRPVVEPPPTPAPKVVAKGHSGGSSKPAPAPPRREVSKIGLLGALRDGKGALRDVFAAESSANRELAEAFANTQRIVIATPGDFAIRDATADAAEIGALVTSGAAEAESFAKPEAHTPHVGVDRPELDSEALDADAVARAMKNNVRAIKDCYDRELKRSPSLGGKLTLSFAIERSTGRVADMRFTDDGVGNEPLRSCITSRARAWRFPAPAGEDVMVSFPLVFATD